MARRRRRGGPGRRAGAGTGADPLTRPLGTVWWSGGFQYKRTERGVERRKAGRGQFSLWRADPYIEIRPVTDERAIVPVGGQPYTRTRPTSTPHHTTATPRFLTPRFTPTATTYPSTATGTGGRQAYQMPTVTAATEAEILRRTRAFEAAQYMRRGTLIPSSFVLKLEYDESEEKAYALLGESTARARWYTYYNVPPAVFAAWWEGAASCTTDDRGEFTGRHRKLWVVGKTPSLGAFFNQHIKGIYPFARGRV